MARDQLAVICGHRNWKNWKAASESSERMLNVASTQLKTHGNDLSVHWKHLGRQTTALECLLFPNRLRSRGDTAAHVSGQEHIAESVSTLAEGQERKDMIAIFRAVYNEEPTLIST
jgi:hypothetical protein